MPLEIEKSEILESVCLIRGGFFHDERGWFSEFYKESEFSKLLKGASFKQINRSHSNKKGTLRGLHFQMGPRAQGKLVSCLSGSIFDVAVDIRVGSETYGSWTSFLLEGGDGKLVWIPEGFAHGFQTLSQDTEVLYLTTDEYAPSFERTIAWDDSEIGVEWPLKNPILSDKDSEAGSLNEVCKEVARG